VIALLDTHVLLWWFEKTARLSREQRRVLSRADDDHALGVSDISLWEVGALVEAGRVRLTLPLGEWLARATAAPLVERCAIDPAVIHEMTNLAGTRDWDPADRMIVATARVRGVPLVTSDTRIAASKLVAVVD
jgi:PIN domain nuclease of toxin-antitoxin system